MKAIFYILGPLVLFFVVTLPFPDSLPAVGLTPEEVRFGNILLGMTFFCEIACKYLTESLYQLLSYIKYPNSASVVCLTYLLLRLKWLHLFV